MGATSVWVEEWAIASLRAIFGPETNLRESHVYLRRSRFGRLISLRYFAASARQRACFRRRLAGRKSVAQTLRMASETSATNTSAMTDKEFVFDLLRRLPDDVTIYEIAQQLEFVAAVRQGLAELDSGRSVSIEQIERDLASWSVTVGRKRRRRQKVTPEIAPPKRNR
jgi:hypothetical protein